MTQGNEQWSVTSTNRGTYDARHKETGEHFEADTMEEAEATMAAHAGEEPNGGTDETETPDVDEETEAEKDVFS